MNWNAHVTVAAVIEREGRFLMVQEQIDGRLCLNQPAGHLEPGENLIQAAIRETREETAWEFRPDAVLGIYQWSMPDRPRTYLRTCFSGRVLNHDPEQNLDDGIVAAIWLSAAELRARSHELRSPLVLRAVEDYLAGTRYPLALLDDLGQHSG